MAPARHSAVAAAAPPAAAAAPVEKWISEASKFLTEHRRVLATCGCLLGLGLGGWYVRRAFSRGERQRPYQLRDLAAGEVVKDPQAEMTLIVEWLQDAVVRPIDRRLPGRPFEYDLLAFPLTPMVILVGNHSAGKSTFINELLGRNIQETGVAPTDDGFTVLQRSDAGDMVEDGPTLLSCGENRSFKDLHRFGQAFWGHLKRRRLSLPSTTSMPTGLLLVDTPGMIDMPNKAEKDRYRSGRGYNFLEVVRWFGKRADLILLLFDPDKPGTTGESLDVLTKSLFGLDHKFLIVLNKVDRLDSSLDFARAYGTLGWALAKVIPRKDIPHIFTMFNEVGQPGEANGRKHNLPLETFRKKRADVVAEVLRAKERHWDNVITATEETLRQLGMVATVMTAVRNVVRRRMVEAWCCATMALGVPAVLGSQLLLERFSGPRWALGGFFASYAFVSYNVVQFLRDYVRSFDDLQVSRLDDTFEEVYKSHFIHTDGEDLRACWTTVKPRICSMLRAVPSAAVLPSVSAVETDWIYRCIKDDVWYMRQLARTLRGAQAESRRTEAF